MIQLPRLSGSLSHSQHRQLLEFKDRIACPGGGGESKSESLEFQLLHVHVTHLNMPAESLSPGSEVIMLSPGKYKPYLDIRENQYSFANKLNVTTAFLFGTNAQGQSVCVKTVGFMPYVYV